MSTDIFRDEKGRSLVFIKICEYFPAQFGYRMAAIIHVICLEFFLRESSIEETEIGIHIIIDFAHLSFKNWDMGVQHRLGVVMQNGPPVKIKQVEIINAPWIFKGIWSIVRTWFTKKMRDRVSFCAVEEIPRLVGEGVSPYLDVSLGGEDDFSQHTESLNAALRDTFEDLKQRIIDNIQNNPSI
eukprot:TRINITY_DN3302_c0_g1_i1.p1 TRINITY_DN3302_c0_g1~~TRINITY_DN3302_c0_g1_i1.p1  ORF type:complete len:184 (-),score=28.69 TRINITY_DN3302_c0_g1_i1:13-564(-)